MALYTFIMEFAGGTYMAQVKAPSPKWACVKWAQKLDGAQVSGLGLKGKESLIEQMKEEPPVAIAGVSNTWCNGAFIHVKLALINLVQTERDGNNL